MKVGDLVVCDYHGVGIVVTQPRLSADCDAVLMGVMDGDIYELVDVLCPDGCLRLLTTDELRIISEGR